MDGRRQGREEEEEEGAEEEVQEDAVAVDGEDEAEEPGQDDHDDYREEEEEEEDGDNDEVRAENPRMRITEQEREWALAIKEAVESDPELDNLTDFFYAHLALVEKEDVQAALDRAYKIQTFRQEYGIVESTQMAMKYIEEDLDLFPGYFLSFSWNPDKGRYVIVVDYTKFFGSVLCQKPGAFATFKVADYYMGHMMSPDLEAIRRGIFILIECDGFSWKNNFGIDFFREFHSEIASVYPVNLESVKFFHTGLALNLMVSTAKRFMPPATLSKLQVGCISGYGRLDSLYLVPTLEAVNRRFMDTARACLEQYYINVASFSLDD